LFLFSKETDIVFFFFLIKGTWVVISEINPRVKGQLVHQVPSKITHKTIMQRAMKHLTSGLRLRQIARYHNWLMVFDKPADGLDSPAQNFSFYEDFPANYINSKCRSGYRAIYIEWFGFWIAVTQKDGLIGFYIRFLQLFTPSF